MTTWKEIYKAGEDAGFYQSVMAAEENASFTIHIEHAAPADQFDEIALATLCDRLSSGSCSAEEVAFFEKLGVRF